MAVTASPYLEYLYPVLLLRINGNAAPDILSRVEKFTYNDHIKKVDEARIVIVDKDKALIGDPRIETDVAWSVSWGYPGDMSSTHNMQVKAWEPDFLETGELIITVVLHGKSSSLTRVRQAKNHGKLTSSDVARAIASKHQLKTKIEPSNDADTDMIQTHDESDFAFLHRLADAIDFEFFVEHDTLYFRSAQSARSEAPRFALYWPANNGQTLVASFKPTIKGMKHSKVKAHSGDTRHGGKALSQESSSTTNVPPGVLGSLPPQPKNPVDPSAVKTALAARTIGPDGRKIGANVNLQDGQIFFTPDAANLSIGTPEQGQHRIDKRVQKLKRDALESAVMGEIKFAIGSPRFKAKALFELHGFDQRLSGLWYGKEVTHELSASGYDVKMTMHRGAYGVGQKPNANQKTAPTNGSGGTITHSVHYISAKTGKITGEENAVAFVSSVDAIPPPASPYATLIR